MKTTKMSTIVVLALGLMVWSAELVGAAPMGTAFTYQGRLIDANSAAEGLYDFQFKLYDDANTVTGNQVGSDVNEPDLDVIDGYFTVELDFGSDVFDGNAVWLEIDVRPGDSNDPNAFITLSPRQQVTPTPYALQTRGIFVDKAENVGIGTTTPKGKLHVDGGKTKLGLRGTDITIDAQDGGDGGGLGGDNGGHGGNIILLPGEGGEPGGFGSPGRPGNVGIGTTKPNYELDVVGNINFTDNLYQNGSLFPGGGSLWTENGSDIYFNAGNVGIGTTSPSAKLEVAGDVTVKKISEDVDISLVSGTGNSSKLLFGNRFEPGAAAIKFDNLTQVLSFKNWMTDDALVITQDGDVGIGTTNPGAKLEVNGDLKVKGAYLGSFPRPAYDSGWVAVAPQMEKKLTHNLGGNVDNYVVDMQMKSGGSGINNFCIGTDTTGEYWYGASWRGLTTTSIWVFRAIDDYTAEQVRIRIWVYK